MAFICRSLKAGKNCPGSRESAEGKIGDAFKIELQGGEASLQI